MKIIDRYIIKTLFQYILIVSCIWLLIFSFFDILGDIDNIGAHNYGLWDALYIQVLNAPATIYRSLIVIILIAAILALGSLAQHSEFIIARSSGKSISNIVLLSTAFCVVMMLVISLPSERYAVDMKNNGVERKQELLSKHIAGQQNLWLKEGKFVINIKDNFNNSSFANLKIFEIQSNTLLNVLFAKRAIIKDNHLVLSEVIQRNFDVDNFSTRNFEQFTLPINFTEHTINMFKKRPKDLSVFDIYEHNSFLAKNNVVDKQFQTELYQRLVKPLILAITIIFTSLFVFTSLRSSSMGKKIFLAVIVSLFFELTLRISSSLVVKFDYNYIYVVILPLLVLFGIVLFALYKKSNE